MGCHVDMFFEAKRLEGDKVVWEELLDTVYHEKDRADGDEVKPGWPPFIYRVYTFYWWLGYEQEVNAYNPDYHPGGIIPIARPRGWPEDYVQRKSQGHGVVFSKSWLSGEEILAATALPVEQDADQLSLEFQNEIRRLTEKHGEVRVVFCFD